MNDSFQPTIALRGLPGLGWVDPFLGWPHLTRLPTVSASILLLAYALLAAGAEPITVILMIAAFTVAGATLAVLVIISRGAQTDLLQAGYDDLVDELSSRSARLDTMLGHVYGFLVCCIVSYAMAGNLVSWLTIFKQASLQEVGIAGSLCEAISMIAFWVQGVVSVHYFAFCFRQLKLFTHLARTIDINLLRIDLYQFFSMQFMRYLLLFVTYLSLLILVIEIVATPEQANRFNIIILAPFTIGALSFAYFFVAPIVLIRNRIRAQRLAELEAVRAAIAGNRERLNQTSIASVTEEFSVPDLLVFEQKLENLWDWPIQNSVQRLVLYVALPPVAWIMAALVERMVDSLL